MNVELVIFLCFLLVLVVFLVVTNMIANILPVYEDDDEFNPFIGTWTNDDIDTVYYFDEENFSYHKKSAHSEIHRCKYIVEDGVTATIGNVGLVTAYLINSDHIRLCLKGLDNIDLYRQG